MDFVEFAAPFVAFIIAFFCSQAGISGAFLILPMQITVLGVDPAIASSTNFVYNLVAIPGGIYGYWRERRLLLLLSLIIIAAYIPGIYLGALFRVHFLLDPRLFKLFVAFILMLVCYRLLKSALTKTEVDRKIETAGKVKGDVRVEAIGLKKLTFSFWGEKYKVDTLGLFALSLLVGVVGGVYGIGGGVITSGILVSLFKLPAHAIAGANLFATFISSIVGFASYSSLGYPPNLFLGVSMGIGGAAGSYVGSRLQKYLLERKIKVLIALVMLIVSLKYIVQYIIEK